MGWLGLGLLVFILLVPVSIRNVAYREGCLLDLLHTPFAAVFSVVVFHLVCGPRGWRFPSWPIAALLMGLFLLSEWVQPYFNRSFSWLDLYYDFLGILGGWILFAAHRERVKSILWGLVGVLLLTLIPYGIQMLRLERIKSRFPELAAFVLPEEKPHWTLMNCEFEPVREHGRTPSRLKVLEPGEAAFFMEHPIRDWQEYTHLLMEIQIPRAMDVTLRIDDRKSTTNYFDRFQSEFRIRAGLNQYCQPLTDLKTSSGTRYMDVSNIYRVGLILHDVNGGETISLKTLVLRRDECY